METPEVAGGVVDRRASGAVEENHYLRNRGVGRGHNRGTPGLGRDLPRVGVIN